MGKVNRLYALIGAVALLMIAAAAVTYTARSTGAFSGDDQTPIAGEALQKASAAALASTGGGRVTATEDGDEESAYEVEVTLDDGSQVDVQLDENFKVVGSKPEAGETADDGGGNGGYDGGND